MRIQIAITVAFLATASQVSQAQENRKSAGGNGPNGVPGATFINHRLGNDPAGGISTMDRNGDGLPDLVTGAYWYERPKKEGVLRQAYLITDSYDTEGGVSAYIDGDGVPDPALAYYTPSGVLWIDFAFPTPHVHQGVQRLEIQTINEISKEQREKQILLNQQWPFPDEGEIVQQQDGPKPR